MSRGVVLWPDTDIGATVRCLWRELAAAGLPSMETHTHRLHQPHVSLVVADDLDHEAVSRALEAVPLAPIPCRIEVAGFFPGGVLLLPLVPNVPLIEERPAESRTERLEQTGRARDESCVNRLSIKPVGLSGSVFGFVSSAGD
jgi:hypothetical protein